MSNNEQKSTNKKSGKAAAGDSEPQNTVTTESTPAHATDKSEVKRARAGAKSKTKPKTKTPTSVKEEIKTQDQLPETKMEVHHHPQLEHNPKPWKEYLIEGFMIFIAVMMGFIAENIREDITNNEHVRQLTTQLVQDLKADTIQLNEIFRAETRIVKYNDTLFNLLQIPLEKTDTRRIQKLVAASHSMWPFHPSAGAIDAIKNELHLKQFSNSEIISYFSGYERHIELLHTAQDINLQYQRIYLDPFLTQHFTPANMIAAFSDVSTPTAKMRNLTQGDLDQLAADIVLIRIVGKEMITDNRKLNNDAVNLLKYVIKQYRLEDK
jgi:hypothetical protein